MMLSIKYQIFNLLKRIEPANRANSFIKARYQEHVATCLLRNYKKRIKKGGIVQLSRQGICRELMARLKQRGVNLKPKKKGDLNIFLAFPLSNWEFVLPVSLASFGQVTTFEWRALGFDDMSSDWLNQRDSMNKSMLEIFLKVNSKKSIDVVVGYLSNYNTSPQILQKMGEAGAVIFNFNWDDKLGFQGKTLGGRWTGPASLASVVDLNLTNAPDSIIKYMVEGGLAMFWPEAALPDIHKPYDLPFEYDVSFVGGKYGWRPKFITKLQKMGINVTCFGNGWGNGPLSDEEMVKLYSRSRINLGFAGVGHSRKLMCLKGRDFEVPMSGGLYLTQNNSELSLVYDIGKEIVTYREETDCAEKIRWLLDNPEDADKIRKAGKIRALKEHTWEKRFQQIFSMAGLLKISASTGTE